MLSISRGKTSNSKLLSAQCTCSCQRQMGLQCFAGHCFSLPFSPKPFIRAVLVQGSILAWCFQAWWLAFLLPALDLSTLSQSVLHQMRGSTVCWQEDGTGSTRALVSLLVEHPERVAWLGALAWRLRRALREPKWICIRCFGSVIIWQDASGKTCGGHTAENLLLCGVTLVHSHSLLSGVGKCGHGLLGRV